MPNTIKKNTRGRPRILNKETIINIAFDEYWINGISEVPLSSIARLKFSLHLESVSWLYAMHFCCAGPRNEPITENAFCRV